MLTGIRIAMNPSQREIAGSLGVQEFPGSPFFREERNEYDGNTAENAGRTFGAVDVEITTPGGKIPMVVKSP